MNIVFFSAVRFNSVISGRTKQLATEIAVLGHNVWFVEMPSLRNLRTTLFKVKKTEGVSVITLPPFPFSHKLMETLIGRIWCKTVSLFLEKQFGIFGNIHSIVSTPWWVNLVKDIPFETLTYDLIDHISVQCHKKHKNIMCHWEELLLSRCCNVFIVRSTLKNEIRKPDTLKISLIPNGVPGSWLKMKAVGLLRTGRPQIGFVGSLYEWIDQKLVCSVAQACPEMDFVFVGPIRKGVPMDLIQKMPNVLLRRPISFDQVPGRIQSFDLCIIPFKRDIVSECADPLKLYEYLAIGKPVVSSVNFNAKAPVYIGSTTSEFVFHIQSALNELDRSSEYQEFASGYTWQKQARKVVDSLGQEGKEC